MNIKFDGTLATRLQRNYRGAIALSNIGVSLLERHRIRHGLDVLKDAVLVCKQAFHIQVHAEAGQYEGHVETKLARASRHLATTNNNDNDDFEQNIQVFVVSDGESVASMKSVMEKQTLSDNSCVFPVRLECHDQTYDLDQLSATILHNFATAHLVMSRLSKSPVNIEQMDDGAEKLSGYAYSILSNYVMAQREAFAMNLDTCSTEALDELTVYLLGLVTLQTRCVLMLRRGDNSEAAHTLQQMVLISAAIPDMVDAALMVPMSAAAA